MPGKGAGQSGWGVVEWEEWDRIESVPKGTTILHGSGSGGIDV